MQNAQERTRLRWLKNRLEVDGCDFFAVWCHVFDVVVVCSCIISVWSQLFLFFAKEFAALRDALEHSKSYEQLGATADVWIFQFKERPTLLDGGSQKGDHFMIHYINLSERYLTQSLELPLSIFAAWEDTSAFAAYFARCFSSRLKAFLPRLLDNILCCDVMPHSQKFHEFWFEAAWFFNLNVYQISSTTKN